MGKSGESLTNSYFANASGKEFVEHENDITFIDNGDIVYPQRQLSSHTTSTPKTTKTAATPAKSAKPVTTAKKPTAPRVSTDGTVAAGKMKGITNIKCKSGDQNCFEDKNGNSYKPNCASIKDKSLGSNP